MSSPSAGLFLGLPEHKKEEVEVIVILKKIAPMWKCPIPSSRPWTCS
jgi:hypothetical protein